MAVDAFIKFTPAEGSGMPAPIGESQDSVFKNYFEIKDFSFGAENPTTIGSASGGAGAGKVKFNEFTIKKPTDTASPIFFKNCAAGAHYGVVTLAIRKAGADPTSAGKPFLVYNFGTVFTTKIDWSGPGDEAPEESITFVYGALSVAYAPQDKAGKLGTLKEVQWNQMTNKGEFAGTPVLTF